MSTFKGLQLGPQFALTRPQLTPYPENTITKEILMKWNLCSAGLVFVPFCSSLCAKNTLISSMTFLFLCSWHQTQVPCTCFLFGVPGFLSPYKSDHEDSTVLTECQSLFFLSSSWRSTQGTICTSLLPNRVWWPFASGLWVQLQFCF